MTATEEETLQAYRASLFEEMGFSPEQAQLLAYKRDDDGWLIDTHKVRKLVVVLGCSPNLAMRILV